MGKSFKETERSRSNLRGIMKDIFQGLIANTAVKEHIGFDIAKGRASHAYIIEGPAGSGKHTIARMIASALSCLNSDNDAYPLPCGVCDNCRKIRDNNSGDVVYVNKEDKASIGVDAVRSIREGLYVMPNDSDYRTYIIEEADKMTPAAQNAFLLSLEEPPSFVVFLLLTEDRQKLLETIRSRAQIVRTESIKRDDMREYLLSTAVGKTLSLRSPDEIDRIISMSGGVIGKALMLMSDNEESSAYKRAREIAESLVSHICKGKKADALRGILEAKITSAAEAKEILILAANSVRDMIAVKKNSADELLFYVTADEALVASADAPMKKLMLLNDEIYASVLKIEANVSHKNVISELIMKTSHIRRSV